MIKATALAKKYGSFEALRGIDLEVGRGEIFAFLGPNGAGKTTTIRILTGVLLPDGGDASVCGASIVTSPIEAKKRIGYLPDIPTLFEKLTGAEYLNFIMDVFAIPAAERDSRTREMITSFGLADSMNELVEGYSLGMRKKLGLIAAVCHSPDALVLDEPTSGLDPQSVRMFKDVLRDQAQKGVAVFFSTHILEIAEKICNRVGIISRGKMVATGTMEEVRGMMNSGSNGARSLEDVFLELTASGTGEGGS